jgi:hypothetical protein
MFRPKVEQSWSRLLLGLALATGCEAADGRECLPKDYIECSCVSGERGYAVCDDLGSGYGECGFCGTVPPGAGGQGEGGGLLAFMSECEADAECETELCFEFNAKGPHCSHPCSSDAECESPSPGCNKMGVCKAP